jgi:hypothetical protein
MRHMILIATVVVMWVLLASAQTKSLPPTTLAGAGFAGGTQGSSSRMLESQPVAAPRTNLSFCPRGQCLYYAGDCDSTSPNNNGLFDFDNPGLGITDAEVWVGVKPTKNAVITGTSGNYWTTAGGIGTNPTPFAVRTGISAGNGGKLVCSTTGNAVFEGYYMNECTLELGPYNYYIAKLAKACRVKAGKTYYIDLTPQYNDSSTIGYLADDDGRHANRRGWPEIKDKSYFNSSFFGTDYQPAWGSGGACAGIGCDGFSMSLTGTQGK